MSREIHTYCNGDGVELGGGKKWNKLDFSKGNQELHFKHIKFEISTRQTTGYESELQEGAIVRLKI